MDKEIIERYIGKDIYFLRGEQWSAGKLLEVSESCIVIEFKGTEQVYSLSTILGIRENRGGKR